MFSSWPEIRYDASLTTAAIMGLKGTSRKDKSRETMTLTLWTWIACCEEEEGGRGGGGGGEEGELELISHELRRKRRQGRRRKDVFYF